MVWTLIAKIELNLIVHRAFNIWFERSTTMNLKLLLFNRSDMKPSMLGFIVI